MQELNFFHMEINRNVWSDQTIKCISFLACIINAFSLMQMRGIGTCRYSSLFQAFRNEAGALK